MPRASKAAPGQAHGRIVTGDVALLLALLAILMLAAAACSEKFEPIAPGTREFSVFGYLDASADTQWIRITPIRTLLRDSSTEPTGIVATLRDVASGRTIPLRETTRAYSSDMLGSAPAYGHEFWTAERLAPGATYRFRAESPAGTAVESDVALPSDFRLAPAIRQAYPMQGVPQSSYASVRGLSNIAFAFWFISFDSYTQPRVCRMVHQSATAGYGGWLFPVPTPYEISQACGPGGKVMRTDVAVVGSAAPWPFNDDFSTWRLAPPASASVGGVPGFIGGVLTKRTRVEDCKLASPGQILYCELAYDSTTGTLHGRISSTCYPDPQLNMITLTLTELDRPNDIYSRTRSAVLDTAGVFDIGALRPGRHLLTMPGALYLVPPDTVLIRAGQVTPYDRTIYFVGTCFTR